MCDRACRQDAQYPDGFLAAGARLGPRLDALDEMLQLARQRHARDVTDPSPWPEAQLVARDNVRLLHQCIDHLSKEKAEAVRSAYFDGESYEVLAQRYNVPLNTMRTWLRRSLIKLRQAVEA